MSGLLFLAQNLLILNLNFWLQNPPFHEVCKSMVKKRPRTKICGFLSLGFLDFYQNIIVFLHGESSKTYMLEAQKLTCWRLKNVHAGNSKV